MTKFKIRIVIKSAIESLDAVSLYKHSLLYIGLYLKYALFLCF